MLELNIKIVKSGACKITVSDNTGFYTNESGYYPMSMTGFLDETRNSGGKAMFKLSDVNLHTCLYYQGSDDNNRFVQEECVRHYEDCEPYIQDYERLVDCQHFMLNIDGWYSVFYFSLPSKDWFDRELERYRKDEASKLNFYTERYIDHDTDRFAAYSGVYYSKYDKEKKLSEIVHWCEEPIYIEDPDRPGYEIFSHWEEKEVLLTSKQIIEFESIEDTTIIRTKEDVIATCNLEQCWYDLALLMMQSPNPCGKSHGESDQTRYKRDFMRMVLEVIKLETDIVVGSGSDNFASVQKKIENINYCGLCKDKEIPRRQRCSCLG